MDNKIRSTLSIWLIVGTLLLAYGFWTYAHIEAYCFLNPTIDTNFAPGYSEDAFGQITNGMTVVEVRQKLGEPLYIQTHSKGELWSYSSDGKFKWGDWAWLCRQVNFSNSVVIEVRRLLLHD